jgi:hypothetical protein
MMKLILSIILILVIAMEYFLMSDPVSEAKIDDHGLKLEVNNSVPGVKKLERINAYNSIVERPLFIAERRFEEEKKVKKLVTKAPVIQDLRVQALGIALAGDGLLAVVKDLKNGQTLRLHIGDELYGWSLKSVSEISFTFSKGGKEKLIKFKE